MSKPARSSGTSSRKPPKTTRSAIPREDASARRCASRSPLPSRTSLQARLPRHEPGDRPQQHVVVLLRSQRRDASHDQVVAAEAERRAGPEPVVAGRGGSDRDAVRDDGVPGAAPWPRIEALGCAQVVELGRGQQDEHVDQRQHLDAAGREARYPDRLPADLVKAHRRPAHPAQTRRERAEEGRRVVGRDEGDVDPPPVQPPGEDRHRRQMLEAPAAQDGHGDAGLREARGHLPGFAQAEDLRVEGPPVHPREHLELEGLRPAEGEARRDHAHADRPAPPTASGAHQIARPPLRPHGRGPPSGVRHPRGGRSRASSRARTLTARGRRWRRRPARSPGRRPAA